MLPQVKPMFGEETNRLPIKTYWKTNNESHSTDKVMYGSMVFGTKLLISFVKLIFWRGKLHVVCIYR